MYCSKCGKEIKDGAEFCTNCGEKVNNTTKGKSKKKIKYIFITIIVVGIVISIMFLIMSKLGKEDKNIVEKAISQNKDENIILFDENTKYGATFNFKQEDVSNAIKSAYQGSKCETLMGEFGTNNSEWIEVNNDVSDYEMYFYLPEISQNWREMGMLSFKIGIDIDTNNCVQSINFHMMDGQANDDMVSKIISNDTAYEEYYYFILNKLFKDNKIITNMNKVENANKVNGIGTGAVTIKDNIMYGYVVDIAEGTAMYSRQFSIGTVGNEKAEEIKKEYKSYNTGFYIELDEENVNTESNLNEQETIPNVDSVIENTKPSTSDTNSYTNEQEQSNNKPNSSTSSTSTNTNNIPQENNTNDNTNNEENSVQEVSVSVKTGYLLTLAGLGGSDYETVHISLKINGVSVCDREFNRERPDQDLIFVGWYNGVTDKFDFDLVVEGTKVNQPIKYQYNKNGYLEIRDTPSV